jgi:hypothetical protein
VLVIEIGLTLLAVVIGFAWPGLGETWSTKAEAALSRLARKRGLAVIAVGVAALILRAVALPVEPIPEPIVHDEFGYLLTADTFAHGRLANPVPPMWEHFETFHVMFHPTYASIYPPAQGLFLAFGKVVFGHPFWGVWLSDGLMCAAITWMLQGWLSPEWALLGGTIAVSRYGVFGYWANSYWGGAVGAIGGALVLGALPRIKQSQRVRDAQIMGIGLAVLANSRPYEGFIFSLPVAVIILMWLFRRSSPQFRITLPRVIAPLLTILVLIAAEQGYYLWRVTGSPFRMPYQIERQTYAVAPYMIWQHIRPEPIYRHAVMRKMFVEEEMLGLNAFRSIIGFPLRAYLAWGFFIGPVLTLPFLMLALTLPSDTSFRKIKTSGLLTLFLILAVFIVGTLLVNFYSVHYSAPATGLVLLLLILSWRQLRQWGKSGLFLARAVALICVISFAIRMAAKPLRVPLSQYYVFGWYQENWPNFGRATIERQLMQIPGKHLVIVHYKPDHEPFAEWVYNDADIDRSKIIWARELGPAEDAKLIRNFQSRSVWFLDADGPIPQITPYLKVAIEEPKIPHCRKFTALTESVTRSLRSPGSPADRQLTALNPERR